MIYHGTDLVEVIQVHPMDAMNETHYINLVKCADEPMFYVNCCCDEDWGYEFQMNNNSDYERVKLNIFDAIWECEDMDSLMRVLSETFEDGFANILVEDECNGDCEHCERD